MEGNIVVDGVLASCYPSTDHDMAHLLIAPLRWIPELTGLVFGEEKPFASYVKTVLEFGKWIIPLDQQKYF